MYWLKLLRETQEEAREVEKTRLEEFTSIAMARIVGNVQEQNAGVLRAYHSGGPGLYHDMHLEYLARECPAQRVD